MRVIPETRVDGQIFVPDAMWAEPREGNFCRKLKQVVENREKLSKEAEKLSESLIKTHSLLVLEQKFSSIMETHLK
jgi:hypothetical protein